MKRIHMSEYENKKAVVRYNSELKEYIVKLYIDGKLQADCDYYTDDKDDAINTSELMICPVVK
jgi:hypothetical protein